MKQRITVACFINFMLLIFTLFAKGNDAIHKTNLLHLVKFGVLAQEVGSHIIGQKKSTPKMIWCAFIINTITTTVE